MTFRVAPSHATQMKNSYLNNCETSTTQFLWLITAYAYDDGNSLTNNSFVTTSIPSPDCRLYIFMIF